MTGSADTVDMFDEDGHLEGSGHSLLVPHTDQYLHSGNYVEMVLRNVPRATLQLISQQAPLTIFSMLNHENKVCKQVIHEMPLVIYTPKR